MRLLLRAVDGTGHRIDLRIDLVDDATIGELADRLAAQLGVPAGSSVVGRWPIDHRADPPSRDRPVATDGPRSGSTVELVDPPSDPPSSARPAPARLVGPGGSSVRLQYGTTTVGGATVLVGDDVQLLSRSGSTVRVNGAPLLGHARMSAGDLLSCDERVWTLHIDGELRPPPRRGGLVEHHARPVLDESPAPRQVALPTPPGSVRLPGFPVLSAMVPLLMGAALWVATRSAASVVFVLFSFVFVVASGLESRRESRAEDRFRVAEFRNDLGGAVQRIEELQREQCARTRAATPTAGSIGPDRLWERAAPTDGSPSLRVRVGVARVPTFDPIVVAESGRRELRDEAATVADRLGRVEDAVTIDLRATGGVVVSGVDECPTAVARSIVVQLMSLVGPDDLQLVTIIGPGRREAWSWTTWLPHRSSSGAQDTALVVVDGAGPAEIEQRLAQLGAATPIVVWVTGPRRPHPEGIHAELVVEGERGVLRVGDERGARIEEVGDIRLDLVGCDEAEPVARVLCGLVPAAPLRVLRPGRPGPGRSSRLPARVRLAEVIADARLLTDPEVLAGRWSNTTSPHRATPIGIADGGGVVHLDLRSDGPHALVAGTTGSGKSELLRTFIASTALHAGPEQVTFLLVDYKGGAAFRSLSELPHTVGMITDLDEQLARRALTSLRAEVRRREEQLAVEGAAEWSGAALVVVVDEFATMANEVPEFVDGLVDLAQRGRSLGVQLVLATQRPAGVVTDAIRANAALRLSLRVADEDDSRDVVDSPVAAAFPRDLPGRAAMRAGPSRTATIQVAFSGGPFEDPERVVVRALDEPDRATPSDGPSELDLCVATARAAATRAGIPTPRRPWIDPLPALVDPIELPDETRSGRLSIGWVDRPELQERRPLQIDLERDGGALVLGASGSGRSTTLITMVAALVAHRTDEVQVYAIDSATTLGSIAALRGVGDVLPVDDVERVMRLLRATDAELAGRIAAGGRLGLPRRVLVIDGMGAFDEIYERIDRGEGIDLVARLVRDGRAVGLHVVVAANRRSEVPASIANGLGARLQLRCSNDDDAALAGLPPEAADPDLPPGRCWHGSHLAQVARVDVGSLGRSGEESRTRPDAVRRLPTQIPTRELSPSTDWHLAVGLDAATLSTAHLDLTHHHGIVAGPPRSGCSTTLGTLATSHGSGVLVHPGTAAPPAGPWTLVTDDLRRGVRAALDAAESGLPTLLVVDDLPAMLEGVGGADCSEQLTRAVEAARTSPLRLVVAGEVDALLRCYAEPVAALRSGRTGLLLCGDPDLHASLFHTSVTSRTDLPPAPGRGWLFGPSTASRLQVARPDSGS